MILGIDVSTYLEQQRISHPVYKKNGKEVDPFELFKNNGVTLLRTRIWNNPYSEDGKPYLAGTCDLDNFINLAKRLEKYGFKHLVDFHYSDFWVDPSKQYLPKAWMNLSFDELVQAVYEFTRDSLLKIKENKIDVEMVQVGNEITNGMLFPHGQLLCGEDRQASFDRYATLIKSGIKGVKEVYPNAKIVIHLERSFDQDAYREIISNLLSRGVKFDILGSSYYPFWHHGFDEYFANMDMVQKEFGIPVMNAELGYPFTTIDYKKDEDGKPKHLVINADNIEDFLKLMPYYPDRDGQARFVKEFIRLAKEHNLLGVCYWEPLWIPGEGICWASREAQAYQHDESKDTRNEWANQCLFDYEGNALPALDEYKI
jgi:arabinogalactan endo-1,4-beta-galactosidase